MVSSVFDTSSDELIKKLREIAARYADDPEYQALRAKLPAEFDF
jgi:hypothetical protein